MDKWKTINSEFCGNYKVFDLYIKERENPKTKNIGQFTVTEAKDWVNIIPITKQNEIILVEQYRHGIDDFSLEIPAGIIEIGENPKEAAKRECVEETGYSGAEDAIFLGKIRSNPAFLNNFCHHYLWLNCELKFEQNLDENEDIKVSKIPLNEINNFIKNSKINHSLAISAFYFLSLSKLVAF